MMKKNLFLVLLYLMCNAALAQATFMPGYLIRSAGDSIDGDIKIDMKKIGECYTAMKYKGDRGNTDEYKPDEIKGYGFKDYDFISYNFNGQPYFFRVICKGKVMLYDVMYSGFSKGSYTTDYYVSKKGDIAFERVKMGKIKKQLGDYMKDNPAPLEGLEEKFDLEKVKTAITKYNKG